MQYSKGVRVGLNPTAKDLIRVVPKEYLLQGNIEFFYRGLILACLGADARGSRVEKISRFKHELTEASDNVKQANEEKSAYEGKLAWAEANRKIVEARAAELERRDRERLAEMAKLKEAMERSENRVSVLETESSELQVEKEAVEADLEKTIEDTLVMLGQSFDQAVCQAHLLYNKAPPSGNFDVNMDVFEGRMVLVARWKLCKPPPDRPQPWTLKTKPIRFKL